MIDVDAAIAALEADRARLDAAIAALRALKNGAPPSPVVAPAPVRRRAPSAPQEHYGKVTPEQWDQARTWWDAGESAVEIGKRLGITDVSVHWHAQQHGWPKRRRGVQPVAPVAVAAAPAVTALEPKRRCPHCAGMTATDPCSWCKKGLTA
jgi:hypothetical protein